MNRRDITLSDEQQIFIDTAKARKNILVDACIGSGKTTAIQRLCSELPSTDKILYLTYNKLLKLDAKSKIKNKNATITNYHGFAYSALSQIGVFVAVPELIQRFNSQRPEIDKYDVLVIDEYQDIEQELAEMLEYIKSTNPTMQIIAVGDIDQKIYDKTTLDIVSFINEFLGDHINLQFTNCFRISSDLASMLGRVWGKTINGVNSNCIVEQMNLNDVVAFLSEQDPKDILCLGSRTGKMSDALNALENTHADKFNKRTVYASIRDDDSSAIKPKKSSAIFTTYDSSKGMERKICVVFDFTESYWQSRIEKPQQSYEILRNIFCVAASRGKEHIIFVNDQEAMLSEKTLSERTETNFNFQDVNISEMFDFKYKEDIEKCYSLLEITPLDYNDHNEIRIKSNDELIDLSPCIGIYQEAEFFSNYNIDKEIELRKELDGNRKKEKYDKILSEKSIEKKILFLVSEETKQKRYRTQVNLPFVPEESRLKLIDRLKTKFSENENVQVHCEIPFLDKNGRKICNAIGFADVVNDETVYELKFVSELKHTHFLQCACYMIALNLDKGILWNTRNNKAYVIKILDRNTFLTSVIRTITKGHICEYHKTKFAVIDTETNFDGEAMSIGIVIADTQTYQPVDAKYYVLNPEYKTGGMFSHALQIEGNAPNMIDTREVILLNVKSLLKKHNVKSIFAYNVSFDYKLLPELLQYDWYDIMKLAAYKQYNSKITGTMDCYSTGKLKRNAGVESIMKLLTGDCSYHEKHNAVYDAMDELKIMKHLGRKFEDYSKATYRPKTVSKQSASSINSNRYKKTATVENSSNILYHVGDKVEHAAFGTGIILSIQPTGNDNLLEIEFSRVGTKKLFAKFARLERQATAESNPTLHKNITPQLVDEQISCPIPEKSIDTHKKKSLFEQIFKKVFKSKS